MARKMTAREALARAICAEVNLDWSALAPLLRRTFYGSATNELRQLRRLNFDVTPRKPTRKGRKT